MNPAKRRADYQAKMTGEILREKRIERGITARYVARKLGIHPSRLCDMEAGRRHWNATMEAEYLKVIGL